MSDAGPSPLNKICPRCGSPRMKRSRSRGFKDELANLFEQRAYRCINCGWRGNLRDKSSKIIRVGRYTFTQIFIIIVVILITLIGIFYFFFREPEKKETPTPIGQHLYHFAIGQQNYACSASDIKETGYKFNWN